MQIEIRLFGNLKTLVPDDNPSVFFRTIAKPATAGQIVRELGISDDISLILTVNGRHTTDDHYVQEGDVINIFPPLYGG
ncbi:MAG: MoaD/ThiS family protein [Deltaproteobacteria bacterium]|nr:MoaD/ThiS family protein [Deltaproteobacteria bacterium]